MRQSKTPDPARILAELSAINRAINEIAEPKRIQRLLVEKTCALIGADSAALMLSTRGEKPRIAAAAGDFPVAEFDSNQNRKRLGVKGISSVLGRSGRNFLEAKVSALG